MDSYKQVLELFKVLSNGNGRTLRIFMILYQNDTATVKDIEVALEIPQSSVSLRLRSLVLLGFAKVNSYRRHLSQYKMDKELIKSLPVNFDSFIEIQDFKNDLAKYQATVTQL